MPLIPAAASEEPRVLPDGSIQKNLANRATDMRKSFSNALPSGKTFQDDAHLSRGAQNDHEEGLRCAEFRPGGNDTRGH
jgi:hypothetical protein